MRTSEDTKKLGEDIISSYKLRIKAVGEIVSATHNMLTDFQKDHKTMSDKLGKNLERGEKDRLKESHTIMAGITKEQVERNKYVTDLLQKFADDQKNTVNELKVMADEVKKSLGKGETDRISIFKVMMGDIENHVLELSKNTAELMNVFSNDHKAMSEKLRTDLSKGEADRLKDFKGMIGNIEKDIKDIETYVKNKLKEFSDEHIDMSAELKKELSKYVAGIISETNQLLGGFAEEREKMASNWKSLNDTMAKLRSGKPIVEKKVKVRTVKEAIEEEKPEPVPEKPVEEPKPKPKPVKKEEPVEKPTPKPKPAKKVQPWEKDIPLEDKVLAFINAHPKGIQVGDMEEPLDVIRMRLGVVAKKLLDAGKVKKVDKVYFPI
ncbi:MAG: hypothetical protein RAP70_01310 [Candidatus Celaenobacter antarcticus]|nr:hypothetical protein [Candidatus Celaenobacter antarcticus]